MDDKPIRLACWIESTSDGFAVNVRGPNGTLRFGPFADETEAATEADRVRVLIDGLLDMLGYDVRVAGTNGDR